MCVSLLVWYLFYCNGNGRLLLVVCVIGNSICFVWCSNIFNILIDFGLLFIGIYV